jgi:hypothetical protein
MIDLPDRTLSGLRNTRDLRAEILSLAERLTGNQQDGRLAVRRPKINPTTVQQEWDQALQVITPDIRSRMSLAIETELDIVPGATRQHDEFWHFRQMAQDQIQIERPNYRFEVLRLLLDAQLTHIETPALGQLISTIGASQTPIRAAVTQLKQAGVLAAWSRGLHIDLEVLSQDLLAKVRALPQTLRFRYERGANPRSSAALVERAQVLLRNRTTNGWMTFALSGTPIAQAEAPDFDLLGTPRLDLTAWVPRGTRQFTAGWIRQLDDGLEPEPSVLTPSPVVVTLVRAGSHFIREGDGPHIGRACVADVFLSLLDMGLREQALQYARAAR